MNGRRGRGGGRRDRGSEGRVKPTERANDTEFGLSGAVFSQDVNRALRVASKLRSGTACINCCSMLDISVPFGGYKQSGWGRELGKVSLPNDFILLGDIVPD